MTHKDLTIVITTFKSEKKINDCLKSIDSKIDVIIVENSSSLTFKELVEKKFQNVKCELTNENLGYGKANNIGLQLVKTKYALILNPDTVLESSALNNFFDFTEKHNDFVMLGPNQDENITNIENIELKALRSFESNSIKGYAMFLNMEKFKDIGFFDENFFLYLEEIDLCKRIKKLNKKIYICPKIIIYHHGGKSVDDQFTYQIELTRNWHWMWSLFYFNKKHFGYCSALILILPKLLSSCFKTTFYFLIFSTAKKEIYLKRVSGILNSILGKESWYRPTLD